MSTPNAPASLYRSREGLGLWEHRGKVAAVGIGHSPTARRWDGTPANSVGGISRTALRAAIEDALTSPRPTVIDVVIDHDAVAPVTAYDRAGRRERMVLDDLDEIVTSRAGGGPPA